MDLKIARRVQVCVRSGHARDGQRDGRGCHTRRIIRPGKGGSAWTGIQTSGPRRTPEKAAILLLGEQMMPAGGGEGGQQGALRPAGREWVCVEGASRQNGCGS